MRVNKAKTDSLKNQRQLAESPARVIRPNHLDMPMKLAKLKFAMIPQCEPSAACVSTRSSGDRA